MTPLEVFESVNDGSMSALAAAATCRKMMAAWDAAYKGIQDMILSEINAYGKEKPLLYGCTFATGSTGNRYDYSQDDQYARIEDELENRKKLLDVACKSGKSAIDDETGEEIHPLPIKSMSTTTILVSIKENEFAKGITQMVYKTGMEDL